MKHYLLLLSFLAVGCTQENNTQPPPSVTGENIQLVLLSAPWCTECNQELPQLHGFVQNELKSQRLKVRVYVTTGEKPFEDPTAEVAQTYRKRLGLEAFEVVPDLPKYTMADTYMDGDYRLPSAVVLNSKNEKVRLFLPGTFKLVDIMDFLRDHLQ